jgi:hypothetical protein
MQNSSKLSEIEYFSCPPFITFSIKFAKAWTVLQKKVGKSAQQTSIRIHLTNYQRLLSDRDYLLYKYNNEAYM